MCPDSSSALCHPQTQPDSFRLSAGPSEGETEGGCGDPAAGTRQWGGTRQRGRGRWDPVAPGSGDPAAGRGEVGLKPNFIVRGTDSGACAVRALCARPQLAGCLCLSLPGGAGGAREERPSLSQLDWLCGGRQAGTGRAQGGHRAEPPTTTLEPEPRLFVAAPPPPPEPWSALLCASPSSSSHCRPALPGFASSSRSRRATCSPAL